MTKQTVSVAYRITRLVAGNGFLAHLEVSGRAILMTSEDFLNPFILSAVQPSGVVGRGTTLLEAMRAFEISFDRAMDPDRSLKGGFEEFEKWWLEDFAKINRRNLELWGSGTSLVPAPSVTITPLVIEDLLLSHNPTASYRMV